MPLYSLTRLLTDLWNKIKQDSSALTLTISENDIVVFVVGPTGSGKSWFIRAATKGDLVKSSNDLHPCTTKVQAIRCELTDEAKRELKEEAKSIVFVDTPSFFTEYDGINAHKEIQTWINRTKFMPRYLGMIYMDRIETDPAHEPIHKHLQELTLIPQLSDSYLPLQLHVVVSYEQTVGNISGSRITKHESSLRAQIASLTKSKWQPSMHRVYFRGEPEVAWSAVEELLRSDDSNVPPQGAVTTDIPSLTLAPPLNVHPQLQPSSVKADPNGTVHVGAPRARNPAMVASRRANAKPSIDPAVTNTPPNDLTNKITRDGNDPVASGGFADIYRGTLQQNGEFTKVAIKSIKTYSGEDGDCAKKQKRLRREIKVWLNLRHDNVLPLLGMTTGFGRFPAMVSPWMENGTLMSYLNGCYDSLSVVGILGLLNDVASGLQYLHSRSVVHGDLSGSNVLIRENGRAYITDFGLSTLLTELGGLTFATSFQARGTLRWTAPELLDLEVPLDGEELPHVAPTTQSDVYSFGGVTLQILSGKVPYQYYTRDAQVIHAVSKGITPMRPSTALVTDGRWRLIQRCWSTADRRPLSEEIVEFIEKELAGANAPQY